MKRIAYIIRFITGYICMCKVHDHDTRNVCRMACNSGAFFFFFFFCWLGPFRRVNAPAGRRHVVSNASTEHWRMHWDDVNDDPVETTKSTDPKCTERFRSTLKSKESSDALASEDGAAAMINSVDNDVWLCLLTATSQPGGRILRLGMEVGEWSNIKKSKKGRSIWLCSINRPSGVTISSRNNPPRSQTRDQSVFPA